MWIRNWTFVCTKDREVARGPFSSHHSCRKCGEDMIRLREGTVAPPKLREFLWKELDRKIQRDLKLDEKQRRTDRAIAVSNYYFPVDQAPN